MTDMYRALFGFEPERVDANTLNLSPGSATDIRTSNYVIMESTSTLTVDVREQVGDVVNGVVQNGVDVKPIVVGQSYFIYIVKNLDIGKVGVVVSSQASYTGLKANIVGSGYTIFRKLPFGFVYGVNGIPAFHLSGWPLPFTRYTDASDDVAWEVLSNGGQTNFSSFSLSELLPDNARMAYLLCKVSGGVGSGYLRSSGSGGSGVPIGYNGFTGGASYMTVFMRVTSVRSLSYKITGGAQLSIFVLGYMQTEQA